MNIKETYEFLRRIMPGENYFFLSYEVKIMPNSAKSEDRVEPKCSIWHTKKEKFYYGRTWRECVAAIRDDLPQDLGIKSLLGQDVSDSEIRELRRQVNKDYEEKEIPF